MATTKEKTKERKFVKASTSTEVPHVAPTKPERREKATGKRIAAVIFWLLAIACEVALFFTLNKTLYFKDKTLYFQIGFLVLDLIFVIIGSQFWKNANYVDPASKDNPVKFFLWNQMGLIVSIIAFVPIVIILLTNKDLDKKTKQVLVPVAAVALVIASLLSIEWNPLSEEEYNAGVAQYGTQEIYYTQWGKKYHVDPDCRAIKNSNTVYVGTIDEAFAAGRHEPCSFCVGTQPQE